MEQPAMTVAIALAASAPNVLMHCNVETKSVQDVRRTKNVALKNAKVDSAGMRTVVCCNL